MVMGDHKYHATVIGHIMGIIYENYSKDTKELELDTMDDERINNVVMNHNFFLCPQITSRSVS